MRSIRCYRRDCAVVPKSCSNHFTDPRKWSFLVLGNGVPISFCRRARIQTRKDHHDARDSKFESTTQVVLNRNYDQARRERARARAEIPPTEK